jgi:hypothetical protein
MAFSFRLMNYLSENGGAGFLANFWPGMNPATCASLSAG